MPVLLPNPKDKLVETIRRFNVRLTAVERKVATQTSLTATSGAKAKVAVFSDGKVGLRVYDSTGALVHDLTA